VIYDNEFVWGSHEIKKMMITHKTMIFRQVRAFRRIITLSPMIFVLLGVIVLWLLSLSPGGALPPPPLLLYSSGGVRLRNVTESVTT
jgi:hypothetical protein